MVMEGKLKLKSVVSCDLVPNDSFVQRPDEPGLQNVVEIIFSPQAMPRALSIVGDVPITVSPICDETRAPPTNGFFQPTPVFPASFMTNFLRNLMPISNFDLTGFDNAIIVCDIGSF